MSYVAVPSPKSGVQPGKREDAENGPDEFVEKLL
jgi:hypothetical protein